MSYIQNRVMSVVPIGGVATLTPNSGGSVGPTAGTINLLGGTGISTVGNPGTSTVTINLTGVTNLTYTSVNHAASPYTVLTSDDYISCDVTGGAITVKLPNAPVVGKVWIIKDKVGLAAANNITVTTVGGAVLIDGATSYILNTAYESANVIFNGTSYEIY